MFLLSSHLGLQQSKDAQRLRKSQQTNKMAFVSEAQNTSCKNALLQQPWFGAHSKIWSTFEGACGEVS